MLAHLETCAGASTTYTTANGRTARYIIRESGLFYKGPSRYFARACVHCEAICFPALCGDRSCTAFLFSAQGGGGLWALRTAGWKKGGVIVKKLYRARHFLAGAIAMALALCLIPQARAALTSRTIEVLQGVDIYVDGVKMVPTDANGKQVETFVYNGTTYVPLRAVSQYLDKSVSWDGENQRAYIGEKPGEKQYLLDVCPPYQVHGYETPSSFEMAGKTYTNGFTLHWNDGMALFNLDGKYETLEFDLGFVNGTDNSSATVTFYLDGTVSQVIKVEPETLPQHVVIPLNHAQQLKITLDDWYPEMGFANAVLG